MSPDLWLYATWLGGALAVFVFVAHMPIIPLLRLAFLPVPRRGRIALCFVEAWLKNCLTIIPDMLAPVVVPVALVFTRWDAEHLPWLFRWWDNDASINGDRRTDDPGDGLGGWALKPVPLDPGSADAISMAYYAPGHHPRSFYARWVWLGLRNRASRLSQMLGFAHATDTPVGRWTGGDMAAKRGWEVTSVGDKWRYFETYRVGPIFFRFHYGYKVPTIPGSSSAPVVAIGFSFQKAD